MLKKVRKQNPGSVPLSRFVATVDGVFSGLWPILCPSLVEFSSFWVIQQTKGKLMRDLHFFIHTVTMMIKAPLTERIQILWDEDWSLKKSAEMIQHRTAGHFINNLNFLRYDWYNMTRKLGSTLNWDWTQPPKPTEVSFKTGDTVWRRVTVTLTRTVTP